eukprot:gene2249-4372_t
MKTEERPLSITRYAEGNEKIKQTSLVVVLFTPLLLAHMQAKSSRTQTFPSQKQKNATKFIIFASARTGSNYLIDILRGHPNILAYGEILKEIYYSSGPLKSSISPFKNILTRTLLHSRHDQPISFMNLIWTLQLKTTKAIGFKIFSSHCVKYLPLSQSNLNTTFMKQTVTPLHVQITNWKNLSYEITKYSNISKNLFELIHEGKRNRTIS